MAHPNVAVVMLTGRRERDLADEAFAHGASGYVVKPFAVHELQLAVQSALTRRGERQREGQARTELERLVAERTAELATVVERLRAAETEVRGSRRELVRRLGIALEVRDRDTGRHTERMSLYCELIARRIGLSAGGGRAHPRRRAAARHRQDRHPGRHPAQDRAADGRRVRPHPHAPGGRRADARGLERPRDHDGRPSSRGPTTSAWTARATPTRLRGEEIPLAGRIAAIGDVFDAASSDRTYRPALSLDDTFDVIVNGRYHHFDAELADVFLEAEAEVRAIARNSQLPGAPPPVRPPRPRHRAAAPLTFRSHPRAVMMSGWVPAEGSSSRTATGSCARSDAAAWARSTSRTTSGSTGRSP